MNNRNTKEWIDNATYEELLRRWRFTTSSENSIFQGELGTYYGKVMQEKKNALPAGESVAVSKKIGWD